MFQPSTVSVRIVPRARLAAFTMPMHLLDRCFDVARRRRLRIVLPEGEDVRVIEAARHLKDEGVADPIVLGAEAAIAKIAEAAGVGLAGIEIADQRTDVRLQTYGAACAQARPTMTPTTAARLVAKP